MGKSIPYVLAALLILSLLHMAMADRGMIIPGGVSVYEPGQKAVIAWDGENEVLILSTDVWASDNTWALELLPLPSQPASPEAGSFDSFTAVQNLLWKYTADVYAARGYNAPASAPLEVIFHENIGAHDVAVVRATSAGELIDFAENALAGKENAEGVSWSGLEGLAASYLQRGMSYWVIDLIDLSDHSKSREPIVYTFKSDYLYFPLEISSLASGQTEITLFTFTNDNLDASSVKAAGFRIPTFMAGGENVALEFGVGENELQQISPRVADLFKGGARLTVLSYQGQLSSLHGDLILGARQVAAAVAGQEVDRTLAGVLAVVMICLLLAVCGLTYAVGSKSAD